MGTGRSGKRHMNSSFFFSRNLIVFNKFTYLCNNVPWPSFRSTKRMPRGEHAIKDLYIYIYICKTNYLFILFEILFCKIRFYRDILYLIT